MDPWGRKYIGDVGGHALVAEQAPRLRASKGVQFSSPVYMPPGPRLGGCMYIQFVARPQGGSWGALWALVVARPGRAGPPPGGRLHKAHRLPSPPLGCGRRPHLHRRVSGGPHRAAAATAAQPLDVGP